jgi:putative molybdopterin biosynthesis protein
MPIAIEENHLYTAEDVAQILRIKKYTVYEIIKRGELPFTKVGKQIRVSKDDLELYLRQDKPEEDTVRPSAHDTYELPARASANSSDVILCGQDICLDLLLGSGNLRNHVLRSYVGCYNSLFSLYHRDVSMVAAHLWDMDTDTYNLPYVKKMMPGTPFGIIRLAGRKQGLYVKKGNPKDLQDWKDFARSDVVMINREKGCGTRILLDQKLIKHGIDAERIDGYHRESGSHLGCASIVAKGGADVACGCESGMGSIAGVEFIPLQLEWYDLVFLAADQHRPIIRDILAYAVSPAFKKDLDALGGYDISQTGRQIGKGK